jgi:glucose-fructose oxidoreductase
MTLPSKLPTRRGFVSAAATTAFTTNLFTGRLRGANDRIAVGFIGTGTRGGDGLIPSFLPVADCQCVATSDCWKERREKRSHQIETYYTQKSGQGSYKGCDTYADFRELLNRKDIDAVAIATPDHWHVLVALHAIRAGKDIYVEKPLTNSFNHAKVLRTELGRTGRMFQYGTQQRSTAHIRYGCELVRNGRAGQIHTVEVLAPCGDRGGSTDAQPVPGGFDYEMWTGPAQMRPYNDDLCRKPWPGHYFTYNYCLGFIAGWGAHPLDVAQWGLGTDDTGPVEYEGRGTIPKTGLHDAVSNWTVRAKYGNGVVMDFLDDHVNRTKFIGTEGWIAISRKEVDSEPKSLMKSEIGPNEIHLPVSDSHAQNFIDSVKSRKPAITPFEAAIHSDAISHLSNIAIRTGRKIRWDPKREVIIDDAEASRMLERTLRAPWKV